MEKIKPLSLEENQDSLFKGKKQQSKRKSVREKVYSGSNGFRIFGRAAPNPWCARPSGCH